MPARPLTPRPRLLAALTIALACLAPTTLLASPISDAEIQKMLTIKPVSATEIMQPGAIQVRHTGEEGKIINILVFNGADGIDFFAQFQGVNISLEDLNHWNANTYFQAFRADADKVRINTRLYLPDNLVNGDGVLMEGYITLSYLKFAEAVQLFHQFLVARQLATSTGQPSASTQDGGTPSAPVTAAKPTATPAETTEGASAPMQGSAPATAPPTADKQQWTFPAINEAFSRRSELQREPFADSVKGVLLSGRGNITEVGRCGFLDDSKRHGKNCIKITLDDEQPRAVLYFPKSRQDELAALEVGDGYRFADCTLIGITDYGFWTTVTCDMP